jgi:biopolymer transport protein ExbD
MKKGFILLIILFVCIGLNAQSIKGKITDEKDKPVKGAVVLLLLQKDSSLVSSALSIENGTYSFDNIKNGNYRVAVDMLGYQKIRNNIIVADNTVTVPDSKLIPYAVSLGEVTVVSTKPFLEQRADKLIVNVENSATAAGSTALEVLQKVPGVIVVNDKITLAGKSSVTIMIDGRPSQYTDITQVLSTMGASNIEKIELIANPGAKYDAAGGAVINIIIKKTANLGTNGSASLSTGMGLYEKGKYGVDRNFYRIIPAVSLNHRKGKLNIFGSLNYLHRNTFDYHEVDRIITSNKFAQINYETNGRNSVNYRAGLDFYANQKNTFGILVRGFDVNGDDHTVNQTQQQQASTGNTLSSFNTEILGNIRRKNIAADFNWKHVFDSTGKELNIDFDYSSFKFNNQSNISTSLSGSSYTNQQLVDNPVRFGVLKIDYTHPLGKDSKLEMGAKTSMATIDNYLVFRKGNIIDPSRTTDFEYKENINAVYASFQKKIEKWEFIAGLRAEQTIAKGNSVSVEVLNRNYWQLFPSAFLTRKVSQHFSTVLQYSRRVDRPGYQQQNPFIQYLDSLTYTKGNPLLRPQTTNGYKFTLTYDNQPFFSVGYTKVDDVIFDDAPKQDGNLTYTTPENLAKYESVVFELNFPLDIGKKISGYGGNQLIYNHYKADYLGGIYDRGKWNWQAYWQISYKPKAGWNFEVSGFYTTKTLNEFLEINPMGSLNFAIQRTFLEKKARISLNFNDLLYSQKTNISILYSDINLKLRQASDSRSVRLSFFYSFGNQKLKAVRNRSTGSDAEANRVKTN